MLVSDSTGHSHSRELLAVFFSDAPAPIFSIGNYELLSDFNPLPGSLKTQYSVYRPISR
jgi:hypothetical protein